MHTVYRVLDIVYLLVGVSIVPSVQFDIASFLIDNCPLFKTQRESDKASDPVTYARYMLPAMVLSTCDLAIDIWGKGLVLVQNIENIARELLIMIPRFSDSLVLSDV